MKSADTKDEKAAAKAELKKDQQAMRERILSVLTPEQRAKAENMRGLFKEKMKGKHGNTGGNKGGKHRGDVDDDGSSPAPSGGTPKSTPPSGGTDKSSGGSQGKTKI